MHLLVVKRAAAAAVAGALVVTALAGCGNNAETRTDGTLGGDYSNAGGWVQLPDGHRVMCVAFGNGGLSCDWNGAK